MEQRHKDWPAEARHLEEILEIVRVQRDQALMDSEEYAEDVRDLQTDLGGQNSLDIGGLRSAQGFLDLAETTQSALNLTLAAAARDRSLEALKILTRMQQDPYFARIDFRFAKGDVRPIYIGRASLMDKDSFDIHIYDWRTPIASVFYQYGCGPAQYQAPAGMIQGDLLLKRQYEIRHGKLHYFFDADEHVLDNFLRDLLSRPAASAMKSIVETIQRDQDQIIRDLETDLLMVQGAAGSGKTSVALHRVAYLMYQGLQERRLNPRELLILAPNATFERYISQVLPDLGEQQVQTLLFQDVIGSILPKADVQPRSAWVEAWLSCQDPAEKAAMATHRSFKGSAQFMTLLDRLIYEIPRKWLPFADIDYDGQQVFSRQEGQAELCNSKKNVPLSARLRMLEQKIWRRIHQLRPARQAKLLDFAARYPQHSMDTPAYARMLSIRESGVLIGQIRSFTRVDCTRLYRRLFEDATAFARLSKGLLPPEDAEALRQSTLKNLAAPALPYQDAAAIAYLSARVHGHRHYSSIRQLVLDEAQDCDALHATLLRMLFPNARFTLLGDIHQTLSGKLSVSFYTDIQEALGKTAAKLVTLNKSFRCTREIWAFSTHFLPPEAASECFSRSGELPQIHTAPNTAQLDDLLISRALACQAQGCQSIALICKTSHHAQQTFDRLKDRLPLALVANEKTGKGQGIFVVSLFMAKGLEFDAVLLCDTDPAHYHDTDDQNLLYIACTRALHQLHLFHTGDPSPLLPAKEDANHVRS